MKRNLKAIVSSFLMVAVLAVTATACSQPAPKEDPAAEKPAAETAEKPADTKTTPAPEGEKKALKVGVTLYARDQFISILEKGISDAAGKAGVTVDVQDAQNDVQKQMDQINSFVTQKCDVLIVNLVNTDIAADLLATVGDTPVIFVNRRPPDEVLRPGKDAYVGSQESEAGRMQGEYLTKYFKDAGKTEINYVLFQGQLGLENTQQRTDSVIKALTDGGLKLNKVFEDTAEWDRAKAMDKTQQILGTGKAFDAVICNNDEMALGAIEAMKLAKLSPLPPVVGIDATADALQAIEEGTMAMSVFQDAAGQGEKCIEIAIATASGNLTDPHGWVPFKPVTKENVAEFK